jgi:hypothetical protein
MAAVPLVAAAVWGQTPDPLSGFDIPAAMARADFHPAAFADVFGAYREGFVRYLDFKLGFSARVYRMVLRQLQNGRVDQQTGGVGRAAERAGIAALLTAAVDSGALGQTLDQNLLTVRGNAEGLYRFATGQDLLPVLDGAAPFHNLELNASFDVSGSGHRLAGAGARFVVVNSRDLRSPAYRKAWAGWLTQNQAGLKSAGADLLSALDAVFNKVASTPASDGLSIYDAWLHGARAALGSTRHDEAAVREVLTRQLDLLELQMRALDPELDGSVAASVNAYTRFFNATQQGFALGNLPMLTVEATYLQPPLQPRQIDTKVVFAWSPKGKGTVNPGTLTLNGGVRGTTSTWRDAQAAVQFDRPLGGRGVPAALSVGGYVQYQIGSGQVTAVADASVTLQLPNSGVKVPLGISWSNRAELVTGTEIRGHIGFSFDAHSLVLAGK